MTDNRSIHPSQSELKNYESSIELKKIRRYSGLDTINLLNKNSSTSLPPLTIRDAVSPGYDGNEVYLTATDASDYFPRYEVPLKQLSMKNIKGQIGRRLEGE